ncbi:hypothetical protein EAO85_14820 [Salmonella enterica subsp. enterica serovar 4,5,12:b:-]|uniref:DUF7167 domain-containing protein n=1 Tax=Salmonella enterica subsp. enterica serovar Javiana TaxID=363569 RepID=A0A728IKC0_SALET|nr:hypothetical protein [Salmonella enterica]EBH8381981.1 hypothetical protein [Salmonella enterica subsp. enterica serovar 4,5,12:b:-]EBH8433353.1 hypothetical protein [Salmonella enterica subsp. enterica serovar Javiana]ECC9586829.1 hypothetical protein [Salmonella enterica subsp. enterica]ECS8963567.1 hypothetical protein [Salmonella enterica subsp. enterica serovar Java]ECT9494478.1 hypothetical protein [Salmonella enterica subsp. enterica serovar 4,[5],12:b:-]MBS2184760.1 hypothetical pr
MSKRFKVYLDSGANIHSKYEQVVELDDIGLTDEEWNEMTEKQRDEVMKEVAWERMEWGYYEIE